MSKYAHLLKFMDMEYHSVYSNVRSQLHDEIVNSYFINKQVFKEKRLIFTAGCYGSGKGHVLRLMDRLKKINLDNFIHVDPDKIRVLLPEYVQYLQEDPWNAGYKTNKEAGYIAELIQLHALMNGYNLIIDGSMKDFVWYKQYIEWIKKTFPNYMISIIYVETSWVKILERNLKRSQETKRCIPHEFLESVFIESKKSLSTLMSGKNTNIIYSIYIVHNDDNDKELINELNGYSFDEFVVS